MPSAAPSDKPRRRLTQGQRLEIARERAKGVPSRALAARFGVSVQTITAAVRSLRDAPALEGQGTKVFGLRVTTQEVRDFEVAISRLGLTKTEALKRLMHMAGILLAPDDEMTDQLRRYGAEINRIGGNLNQLARACNEARLMGQPIPYTAQSHAEVRAAIRAVFETAAQVNQMARDRRGHLDALVAGALMAGDSDEPA
jgi:DNA-binding transcriptional MocR family regulator